jgi:hypothetical protein
MMAARRYATQRYSWGKLGAIFYGSPRDSGLGLMMISLLAILGILFTKGSPTFSNPNLQTLVSFQVIHDAGLLLGAFIGLSVLVDLAIMAKYVRPRPSKRIPLVTRWKTWLSTLISSVMRQSVAQIDFLKCTNRNRYFAHMALFWGFLGLAIATAIDFVIGLGKIPLYPFPPQRVLGVLAGVAFTVAATYYLLKRLRKDERHVRLSHFTDWIFVVLIFLASVSGLLLTLSLYIDSAPFAYSIYIAHLVIVFDLLVLAPFTKFAHSLYRPLAIWMNSATLRFERLNALGGER